VGKGKKSLPKQGQNGRPNDAHALRPEHQVVPPCGLLVIVAKQNARPVLARLRRPHLLPGRLRHPVAIRVRRHAGQVHPSCPDFNVEQHVQGLQPERLDGEEVASHDLLLVQFA
jgi:hypothetical protein